MMTPTTLGIPARLREGLTPRLALGLVLMLAGLLLALGAIGVLASVWPVGLIAVGWLGLWRRGTPAYGLNAGAWILAGCLLLAWTTGLASLAVVGPLSLVVAGGALIWRDVCRTEEGASGADGGRSLQGLVLLEARREAVASPDFHGGSVVTCLGSYEIDLRSSSLGAGGAVLDVTVVWGGLDLRVPEGWSVEWQGTAALSGVADQTRGPGDAGQRLIVTGMVLMGGVRIGN